MRQKNERTTEAHWDAVWARLRKEGRVDVAPAPSIPYCASSCAALADLAANPGCHTGVRVVLQNRIGVGGGE